VSFLEALGRSGHSSAQRTFRRLLTGGAACCAVALLAVWTFGAMRLLSPGTQLRATQPAPQPDHAEEVAAQLRRFAMVYGAVEENYAEPLDSGSLIYSAAIPGMLRTLDPYTVFFDPDQFRQLQQQQASKIEGFGTIVTVMPGRVLVIEAQMGAPAAKAGIQPGDEILEVNGYRIEYLNLEQLVELLTEAKRNKATLRLMRPGSAAMETVVVTPAEMDEPSVDRAYMLEPGIGYVRLKGFEGASADELHAAIEKLVGDGMKALVFDMRDNHGGLVDAAVEIAGFFLPPGSVVLSAHGRTQKEKVYKVREDAHPWTFPMAIVVNKNSASAAEILAGALQDDKRAKLVGQQTYGKGIVQSVYSLAEGTGLALAAAQYFTPAGRTIQKPTPGLAFTRAIKGPGGIAPDVLVEPTNVDNDWQAYLENGNAFLDFARIYITEHKDVSESFQVTPEVLDEFKTWLSKQGAALTQELWTANQSYLRRRVKVEVFNLAFGVARGDQVAAADDPQVQAAVTVVKASRP
jgi:carboxyl-terminal processing protease